MKGQWLRLAALWLRDALLVAATLWLWSRLPAAHDAASIALHIAAALMTALSGYLVHEWGHLLGAWIAGSNYRLPAHPFETFFLFRFDNLHNSRAQYFTMGMGGFAASLLMVALLLWQLPAGMLASWIALGLTAAGVLATFIIHCPC